MTATKRWVIDRQPSHRFPVYTRGNSGEVFPNVMTPMTGSLIGDASADGQTRAMRDLGLVIDKDFAQLGAASTGVFGGYLYGNLSLIRVVSERMPGMSADDVADTLESHARYGVPDIVLGEVTLQHPPDGGDAEMQPRPGQHLRDPLLAERRARSFQIPHEVRYELGELVHGLSQSHESDLTFFIQPPHPGIDRLLGHHEPVGHLLC